MTIPYSLCEGSQRHPLTPNLEPKLYPSSFNRDLTVNEAVISPMSLIYWNHETERAVNLENVRVLGVQSVNARFTPLSLFQVYFAW